MRYLKFILLLIIMGGCNRHDQQALDVFMEDKLVQWNHQLTDVIISDIFTPPQASRIYAYPNIAAYQVLRYQDPQEYPSLSHYFKDMKDTEAPADSEVYLPLSAIVAFSTVAAQLVYNGPRILELEGEFLKQTKDQGISQKVFNASVQYGQQVAGQIWEWAQQDGYNQRTSKARFTVTKNPSRWEPTPPDYMDAIEPHWNTLRPFLLDSAGQFDPGPPVDFDTIPGSPFYEGTLEVYQTVNDLDEERLEIAKFWDCNPNISYTQGHVMYYQQQISPGGHWIHITTQVLQAENLDLVQSAEVMSKVSATIADAFISCWNEKYRSNLVRPETYINRYIDTEWKPILQTPAFPEHTSGHSVASASAATMLTHLFGDNYAFSDSTEVPFGLPTRHFNSFLKASEEAAISRLYGGIHYMPAITKGVEQGQAVGRFAVARFDKPIE